MADPRQSSMELGRETGERRAAEVQTLDDATFEPRTFIEQSGDMQQAEAVQTALVAMIDAASARDVGATPLPIPRPEDRSVMGSLPVIRGDIDQATLGADDVRHDATPIPLPGKADPLGATPITLPQMRIQPEEEEGHPPEPPDLDHNPYPEEMLKASEDASLQGRMPKIRDDLDQTSAASGKEEATPINLPGPQAASVAAGLNGGSVASKAAAEDKWEAPNADRLDGKMAAGFPAGSGAPVEFEKPILHKELKDLDAGLGKLEDIDGLTPGPGKLSGATGEKKPKEGFMDGMPGLQGFEGGPAELKNDAGMRTGPAPGIPGWQSPFPPGKGPNQWADTSAGGAQKPKTPSSGKTSGQSKPAGQSGKSGQSQSGGKVTMVTAVVGPDGKVTYSDKMTSEYGCEKTKAGAMKAGPGLGHEGSIDVNCGGGNHFFVTWNENGVTGYTYYEPSSKNSDEEMRHGKDPSRPLSEQMDYDRMNPKFDSGQISNYPEEHAAGAQGGGMLSEEHEKAIKRTLEHKAKLAHSAPKSGAELVTDPPSPDPGKKSEAAGKEG
ncbi:MAG: hypothetical protein JW929_04060 [Anaerolineales bacterium]|nr:hypothetical protein [Anaerolineales bacterium]